MSMWQPIGVVFGCAISYGTQAQSKYRCNVKLPACSNVASGIACCTVSSNMGWRYEVIIIGGITLFIFFARFFIFTFHESPKFLLSKGREQEAIDVLHKIAAFNKAPTPTLTIEHFRAIDNALGVEPSEQVAGSSAKEVTMKVFQSLKHLRGLFLNKLQAFSFFILALAYMVSGLSSEDYRKLTIVGRLLVIQSCRHLPTYCFAPKQCGQRPWNRKGHLSPVHHHLSTRYPRFRHRVILRAATIDRQEVVAGHFSSSARSFNGYVHTSVYNRRIRRTQCLRVHHANRKSSLSRSRSSI
jgi:hypothetical protein